MRITERQKNALCTANSSIVSNSAIVQADPMLEMAQLGKCLFIDGFVVDTLTVFPITI